MMIDALTVSAAAAQEQPHHLLKRPEGEALFELSRLMAVALDKSGHLVSRAQTRPNGPWEGDWTTIDKSQTYTGMTAGIIGDGRVAAIARRTTQGNGLSYVVEAVDCTKVERWDPPVDLGMPSGVSAFRNVAMKLDADSRLEIFAIDGADVDQGGGRIWWKYQNPIGIERKEVTVTPPGTRTPVTVAVDVVVPPKKPWSEWFVLSGALTQLIAGRMSDGRLVLFGVNKLGHLYRGEQRERRALQPGDWSNWVRMDEAIGPIAAVGRPVAVARDSAGFLNLFAVARGNQVLHARQTKPNASNWTDWSTPGYLRQGVKSMAVGLDGSGRLVLVASDGTNLNVNLQWDAKAQQWSGWNLLQETAPPLATLALDYNADGRLTLFEHRVPTSGLRCVSQMVRDSTEWELNWAQLAGDNPGLQDCVVVRDLTPPSA
jgi:YD repeat-containing protein